MAVDPQLDHSFEQMTGTLGQIAVLAKSYYDKLIVLEFQPEQAMQLVVAWQDKFFDTTRAIAEENRKSGGGSMAGGQ